ncbi:MAG TPA: hypothetical protein VE641_09760 [Chthoniobacterales bacterium]|nr:hypothetical protein [Chthoniobacterales bacterium]
MPNALTEPGQSMLGRIFPDNSRMTGKPIVMPDYKPEIIESRTRRDYPSKLIDPLQERVHCADSENE